MTVSPVLPVIPLVWPVRITVALLARHNQLRQVIHARQFAPKRPRQLMAQLDRADAHRQVLADGLSWLVTTDPAKAQQVIAGLRYDEDPWIQRTVNRLARELAERRAA